METPSANRESWRRAVLHAAVCLKPSGGGKGANDGIFFADWKLDKLFQKNIISEEMAR